MYKNISNKKFKKRICKKILPKMAKTKKISYREEDLQIPLYWEIPRYGEIKRMPIIKEGDLLELILKRNLRKIYFLKDQPELEIALGLYGLNIRECLKMRAEGMKSPQWTYEDPSRRKTYPQKNIPEMNPGNSIRARIGKGKHSGNGHR